jgi:glycosyltransferase involved in cell wall biosynthesis
VNILHTECGLNWGGQEYRTLIETEWLNEHGHRAWVACDRRSEIYGRGLGLGAAVLPVSMRNNADLLGLSKMWKFCKQNKIDVIHTHGPKDSWMCYPLHLAGYPVVRSRHVTVAIKPGFQHTFIYQRGCRRVIATAGIIRDTLIKVNGLDPDRIDVVGEGVDLKEYNPDIDRKAFRFEKDIKISAPLIGNIGMMRGDKGHHFFLDAALEVLKKFPEARFVMVGEGIGSRRVERELRARIKKAGEEERIIMTGYRWDIPKIVAALDMIVVASIEVEAQSRIVPQAFASQRAVIATDVGGIPELVKNEENGLLVPPGSGTEIARAIERLIENPEFRDRLAIAGYHFAIKELCLDRMMEKTLAVYEKAIHRRHL